MGYHRNSAVTHIALGQMLVRQHRADQAVVHFRRALELSTEVLATDPEYIESKIDVASSESNLGNALALVGKKAEGLRDLNEAVSLYIAVSQIDSANAHVKQDFATALGWLNSARLSK